MSRGIRDLRELICVSRLTNYDSVDDDDVDMNSEDYGINKELFKVEISEADACTAFSSRSREVESGKCLLTPNYVSFQDTANLHKNEQAPLVSEHTNGLETRLSKSEFRRILLSRNELTRSGHLSPLYMQSKNTKSSTFLFCRQSNSITPCQNVDANNEKEPRNNNFDQMLNYMDATIVAEWLIRSNRLLEELDTFCSTGDNFVKFSHFWLTDFSDTKKQEIYEMEHDILIHEVGLAFAVGRESCRVAQREILDLVSTLFHEYPSKLESNYLFLDYLYILTSGRYELYKKLLSDVHCSTHNRQYAQWLLATRSFALVSMWCAIIKFYHNVVKEECFSPRPSNSAHQGSCDEIIYCRLLQAIRLGYADVVHFFISRKHVNVSQFDPQKRTILFLAVMSNQIQIVKYLTSKVIVGLDVNQASDTGNTALHAAANSGNVEIVKVLCCCPGIVINCCNSQCENATPLHLAVMHGHVKIVDELLAAGADPALKMGNFSAIDIARNFDHQEILQRLQH